jgi:hypothetical protein
MTTCNLGETAIRTAMSFMMVGERKISLNMGSNPTPSAISSKNAQRPTLEFK